MKFLEYVIAILLGLLVSSFYTELTGVLSPKELLIVCGVCLVVLLFLVRAFNKRDQTN